jgi:vacuolar protein sorting-associated protein VTA1
LPPPPSASYVQISRPPPPPPEPSPPPELTPSLIAKTQKHCRFAISALDYEDVQQARKELHAALAILGR